MTKTLKQKNNYDKFSHVHCWEQEQPSACGIPLNKHKQCCLCDEKYKSMTNLIEKYNAEMVEKFDKTYKSEDSDISFFPYGGDDNDFDEENCLNFLLSNNKELVKRVYEDLLEKLPKEKELEHSLDFARRGYNCYLSEIKKLIKTLI